MTWQEFLKKLIQTPALWLAGVKLYHDLFAWLLPSFPQNILTDIDAIVFVVASIVTGVVVGMYIYAKNKVSALG